MSGGQTSTTTSNNAPPQAFTDAYKAVNQTASQVAAQPYTPYGGQIVADLSPDQQAGIAGIKNAQGAADPYINSAAQHLDAATAPIWSDVAQWSPEAIRQYSNPYTEDVVNATQAQFNNQNAIQQQGIVGDAVSKGAWGGDRSAVAQGIIAGQQQLAQAPVIAGLRNTGYNQAQAEFNQQQGAQIGTTEANRWLDSQAASGMGALGQEALGTQLTGANALLGTGALEQTQAQAGLNVPYQQYLAAQAYPFQTTGWQANIAEGLGGASGGTSSTTSPGPSVASQIAGAGATGVGIAGQFGAFRPSAGAAGAAAAGSIPSSVTDALATSGGEFTGGAWRGGTIPHRAPGGGIEQFSAPGVDISFSPGNSDQMGIAPLGHGTQLINHDFGQTSVTNDPNVDSTFGTILKTAGQIAAGIYGGPAGGAAASALSSQVHFGAGGGITPFPVARTRAPGVGIYRNDNFHPSIPHRAAGGVTLAPSSHGGPAVPVLNSRGIGPVASAPPSSQAVNDYFAQQNAGRSFTLPPPVPAFVPPAPPASPPTGFGGAGPATPTSGPGSPQWDALNAPGGSMARGGWIKRDEGGEIPEPEAEDPNAPNLINNPQGQGIGPAGGPSLPTEVLRGGGQGIAPTAEQPMSRPRSEATGTIPMSPGGGYHPPPPEYAPMVLESAARHGVDPKQLAWLISTESGWNPKAYNASSGTEGLGQFKPGTAREVGVDPWVPAQAIDGAAAYLRKQVDRFGGDYEAAIAHYGTFSTGHGPQADAAVRGRYRAFMGTQGAARGGGIVSLATGGSPLDNPFDGMPDDDNDFEGPPGGVYPRVNIPDPGLGPRRGLANPNTGLTRPGATTHDEPMTPAEVGYPPQGDSSGLLNPGAVAIPADQPAAGSGIAGPPPPPPPPQSGQSDATVGKQVDNKSDDGLPTISPWQKLMNVGLGIMGGTSPYALTNVGKGALTGLQLSDKEDNTLQQRSTAREVAKTNAAYRASLGVLAEGRAAHIPVAEQQNQQALDIKGRLAGAREDMNAWLQTHGDATLAEKAAQNAAVREKWKVDQEIAGQRADSGTVRAGAADKVADARVNESGSRIDLNNARAGAAGTNADSGARRAGAMETNAQTRLSESGSRIDLNNARTGQADANTAAIPQRIDQGNQRLAQAQQRLQSSDEYKQAALQLRASGITATQQNAVLAAASRGWAANGGTKPFAGFLAQAQKAAGLTPIAAPTVRTGSPAAPAALADPLGIR